MTIRIPLALLFTVIGAVVATALTAVTAAAAFVAGVYIGSEFDNENKTETADEK